MHRIFRILNLTLLCLPRLLQITEDTRHDLTFKILQGHVRGIITVVGIYRSGGYTISHSPQRRPEHFPSFQQNGLIPVGGDPNINTHLGPVAAQTLQLLVSQTGTIPKCTLAESITNPKTNEGPNTTFPAPLTPQSNSFFYWELRP